MEEVIDLAGHHILAAEVEVVTEQLESLQRARDFRFEDHPILDVEGPATVVVVDPGCVDGSCSKAVDYSGS